MSHFLKTPYIFYLTPRILCHIFAKILLIMILYHPIIQILQNWFLNISYNIFDILCMLGNLNKLSGNSFSFWVSLIRIILWLVWWWLADSKYCRFAVQFSSSLPLCQSPQFDNYKGHSSIHKAIIFHCKLGHTNQL